MAAFSAGIASARRSSHSFFTAPASSPFLEAAATSISTAAFLGSTTSAFSRLTFSISSSVSCHRLDQVGLERRELVLHRLHRLRGERQLLQTDLVSLFRRAHHLALARQQRREHRQKLQVRRGRDVVVRPSFLRYSSERSRTLLWKILHISTQFLPVLVGDVDVLELLHRDSLERVVGPLLEPVDGAAVDQRRELPQRSRNASPMGEKHRMTWRLARHLRMKRRHSCVGSSRGFPSASVSPAFFACTRAHLHHRRALVVGEEVGHLARC